MRRLSFGLAAALGATAGCADIATIQTGGTVSAQGRPEADPPAAPEEPAVKTDPLISTSLLGVLEGKDRVRVDFTQCSQPVPPKICEILSVGSPIGYALRNRYLNVGVPIADGLARNPDPVFREQLVTLARWDSNPEVRSAALLAVASFRDLKHLDIFRQALVYLNAAVRFGAIEGLIVWGHPEQAAPLLAAASERDMEPILRAYSAAGLARMKDPRGLELLRKSLDNPSWLVRAMAGRYLGEYGMAVDYTELVSRIGREQNNDFVVAEYCIAALNLYARKMPKKSSEPGRRPSAPSAPAGRPARQASAGGLPELEPLVIRAVRDRLPKDEVIDPQINANLLRLLKSRQDARAATQEELEASIGNLTNLTTATGYKLKTRYTELGFLLTEGLAGVKDLQLSSELENTVKFGRNVQVRAAAMAALAYTKDLRYMGLFQTGLQDQNVTVRFAAVESLLVLDDPSVKFLLVNAARDDLSPAVRIYAAQGLWRMGDPYGREILLRHYQDQDWLVRAMASRYIGELGAGEDYRKLMVQLSMETHAAVKVELASALLNLQKYQDR
ncbi:MAG: HEAT repeat domain-containing protein [Elusimicrobia bacterium]|nr:HEAT repeat domain-containing protein [Elusimicrobiota bacterium]